VLCEHFSGFKKNLRQAEYLYKEVSTTVTHFTVNLDIYDGRMMDVYEIMDAKAFQQVVEDTEEEKSGNEGIIMVSLSYTTDPMIEDEEMENPQDVVDGWFYFFEKL